MKNYIFITEEGTTYQPSSINPESDIENCQVIGYSKGNDENEAFNNLISENDYLLDTNFNEIICIELKNEDYFKHSKFFCIRDYNNRKD